jgi:hypothetical protein
VTDTAIVHVEAGRYVGRMSGNSIVGKTADGSFQIGVNKTFLVSADALWSIVTSRGFIELLGRGDLLSRPGSESGEVRATDREIASALAESLDPEDLASIDTVSDDGITLSMTTFRPGSHYRMRWKLPKWDTHSILQIRVTPKREATQPKRGVEKNGGEGARGKGGATKSVATTLTFHQEKLPNENARLAMRDRWRGCTERVAWFIESTS